MIRLELDLDRIGRVSAEGDDPREVIRALEFWRSLPTTCQVDGCDAPVELRHQRVTAKEGANAGKTFDYYRLRCAGHPRHEVTLGQYQDGTGLFYPERREWTAYTPPEAEDGAAAPAPAHVPASAPARPATPTTPRHEPARAEPGDAQPCGLALRARLTREYGVQGRDHARLAYHALGRVPAWDQLTRDQCRQIEAVAHDIAEGRVFLNDLQAPAA